jgi:hypothetical protein
VAIELQREKVSLKSTKGRFLLQLKITSFHSCLLHPCWKNGKVRICFVVVVYFLMKYFEQWINLYSTSHNVDSLSLTSKPWEEHVLMYGIQTIA